MKAIASGNPAVLTLAEADAEVVRMKAAPAYVGVARNLTDG